MDIHVRDLTVRLSTATLPAYQNLIIHVTLSWPYDGHECPSCIRIELLNEKGQPGGDIDALVLDGPSIEGVDRKQVADENRVQLLGKGDGVYSGDFGNEGTGGHSHLKFLWKTGEKHRFLVTAIPTDRTHTDYSGYWFQQVGKTGFPAVRAFRRLTKPAILRIAHCRLRVLLCIHGKLVSDPC